MFATHLHLGIYLYPDGEETSYNPYWILRLAGEKNFLFFLTMLYLNDMEDERMINLPNEFEEKMKALLGDEFEDYIKCYDVAEILRTSCEYGEDFCGGFCEDLSV